MREGGTGRGGARHPLIELTRVRVLEFVREPEAIFWVFVFPVLLALALGIAFRSPPERSYRAAVMDEQLAELIEVSERVEVVRPEPRQVEALLRDGKIDLVVEGELDPAAKGPPTVRFRFDPSRPDARAARFAVDDVLQRGLGREDVVRSDDVEVRAPGSRYIDFLIPGLVGLNLMGSGMWGIGFAVVVSRRDKLLKRFTATPMRRAHFLLSFMLSRLVFLIAEVGAVLGFGWLAFDVQIRGSWAALGLVSLVGAFTFGGLGLLIAARPRTIEAVSGWMNFVMLPMWLLSGTFFSYERFPELVQPLIRLLPLTALNDALREIMNAGEGFAACAPELLLMAIWTAVSFGLALRFFRWR
jgi:ABC-type multidrug transport system permease subunit